MNKIYIGSLIVLLSLSNIYLWNRYIHKDSKPITTIVQTIGKPKVDTIVHTSVKPIKVKPTIDNRMLMCLIKEAKISGATEGQIRSLKDRCGIK